MSGMPWIKLRTNYIDDARMAKINDSAQARFYGLYQLAGQLDADGFFMENGQQLSETDIAFKLRVKVERLTIDIKALKKAKLMSANGHGLYINDFATEQVSQAIRQEQWRQRQQRHRDQDNVTGDMSAVTGDASVTHAPRVRTRVQSKNQEKEEEGEPSTTTLPSSKQRRPDLVGELDGSDLSLKKIMKTLKPKQRKELKTIEKIFHSASLGQNKLDPLLVYMATRCKADDKIKLTLAALANIYDDPKIMNKPVVAAYRIEHNLVPPHYLQIEMWKHIPEKILKAAGIDDLNILIDEHMRGTGYNAQFYKTDFKFPWEEGQVSTEDTNDGKRKRKNS